MDNQCYDIIGPKTQTKLLHALQTQAKTNHARQLILSGIDEEHIDCELAEWLGMVEDYQLVTYPLPDGYSIKGHEVQRVRGRLICLGTGQEHKPEFYEPREFGLNLGYFNHQDVRVLEPLGNKQTARALAQFLGNQERGATIINFGGSLDYAAELFAWRDKHRQPLDVTVLHFWKVYEGWPPTPIEGIFPHSSDGLIWRDKCKSFGELTTQLPRFLVEGLVPEKCLTAITGHSFNGKSWVGMQLGWQMSQGEPVFGHFAVEKPVPVLYNVPEMHEAGVRYYLNTIGAKDTENFLVRTMEDGVWPLDDPQMVAAAQGRAVFLDTQGFFNPGDDGNDYKQALKFGKLVFELLNAGALAVIMLGHLAKPPQGKNGKPTEHDWTLENSLIGSAGYGAVLRSLLRVKNLNEDLNDHNVHLYVQGMKNPGLKPFQLQGPAPLKMLVKPGDSPYLKQLLSGDAQYNQACVLFEKKVPQREAAKQLGLSLGKVNKLHKEWRANRQGAEVFQGEPVAGVSHE